MNPPIPPGESLLEFPCDFPIKIMGARVDDFAQTVLEVVLRHAPDFDAGAMQMRPSSKGNYLAITCTVNAVDPALGYREQIVVELDPEGEE